MPSNIGVHTDEMGGVLPSKLEQATYEKDLYAVRTAEIPSNMQFRAAYSSTDGLPDYVGYAPMGLAEGTDGWLLKKYTYDVNRQCTVIQIQYSNWSARTSGSYT
jgi:hypothetical protein